MLAVAVGVVATVLAGVLPVLRAARVPPLAALPELAAEPARISGARMLALAIVIALMGVANTLSLSIHERTRELGLLRALGQTRAQTRGMIRWESVIIAVFGTLGGVILGTFLGWAVVRSSSSTALAVFAAPPLQLVLFLVLGALTGILAGIRPARRAARLNMISAIAAA